MAKSPLEIVRKICLELPEAHEVEAWGAPTFRVKNKLFVMYASPDNHHGGGRPGIWVKSTAVNQDLLIQSDKDRFFFPPYVGPSGWVGIFLNKGPDWNTISSLVRDGYALTAPKKMLALLEALAEKAPANAVSRTSRRNGLKPGAKPTAKSSKGTTRKTVSRAGTKAAKRSVQKTPRKTVTKAPGKSPMKRAR